MNNKFLLMTVAILIIAMSSVAQVTGKFIDARDGKTYKTVKIGTQTWMAENLAFKTDSGSWAYSNDNWNAVIYGYLYDWQTALKSCPTGWHLPTESEWTTLITFLGGSKNDVVARSLKESGNMHWLSYNLDTLATNSSGFTALPGGLRFSYGNFAKLGQEGYWWSSTESQKGFAKKLDLFYCFNLVNIHNGNKFDNFSVRCIKDY